MMELLQKDYAKELNMLKIDTSERGARSRAVRFDEAKRLVAEKYDQTDPQAHMILEPEEEAADRTSTSKKSTDADFVFVTHYPSKKRPFYAMDDPADTRNSP